MKVETPRPAAEPHRVVVVDPERAGRMRLISVFYKYGMPGMTLRAAPLKPRAEPVNLAALNLPEPPKAKPLIHRCPGAAGEPCPENRPISKNKTHCGPCHQKHLIAFAKTIRNQNMLDALMNDLEPDERKDVLRTILPHLRLGVEA